MSTRIGIEEKVGRVRRDGGRFVGENMTKRVEKVSEKGLGGKWRRFDVETKEEREEATDSPQKSDILLVHSQLRSQESGLNYLIWKELAIFD